MHGGGLINGDREIGDNPWLYALVDAGVVVVSIDYRLAPETKLPAIVGDVEDALRWVREEGPRLFRADPRRVGVAGRSAGGYLALTAGFRVKPQPGAVVSLWGYGDIIGRWYTEASPHARHWKSRPNRDAAWREVSGPPVASAKDRKGSGAIFYEYCRQHGLWPEAVSGWNPRSEPHRFTPFMPVKNVTSAYPPTLLVHGTADTDVPCEQSERMAAQFAKHGVAHRFIRVEGAEHGLQGAGENVTGPVYREVTDFLLRHLASRPRP
jgi:acetyl esterase/lipase